MKLVVRFKDAHMLAYKKLLLLPMMFIIILYSWPFLPFQLKASTEVDSEFTVISNDTEYDPKLLLGVAFLLIREKMASMWVQMSISGKNSVK